MEGRREWIYIGKEASSPKVPGPDSIIGCTQDGEGELPDAGLFRLLTNIHQSFLHWSLNSIASKEFSCGSVVLLF